MEPVRRQLSGPHMADTITGLLNRMKESPRAIGGSMVLVYPWFGLIARVELIGEVIADAEEKAMYNDTVHFWLKDLKNVVYVIEDLLDVLDDIDSQAARPITSLDLIADIAERCAPPVSNSFPKIVGLGYFLPLLCRKTFKRNSWSHILDFCSIRVHSFNSFNKELAARVKYSYSVVRSLQQEIHALELKPNVKKITHLGWISTGLKPTGSFVDPSRVYGREFELEAVIQVLTQPLDAAASGSPSRSANPAGKSHDWKEKSTASSSRSDDQPRHPDTGSRNEKSKTPTGGGARLVMHNIKVLGDKRSRIPVFAFVGMAGIGKTTLAQLVFNDSSILQNFALRLWVWVPIPFELPYVIRKIMDGILSNGDSRYRVAGESLSSLEQLLTKLESQKLLLVLDNVWAGQDTWEQLLASLQLAAPGSRIIVTTRDEKVAGAMQATLILTLGELSDDDCLSIVRKNALSPDTLLNPELQEVGTRIAQRCKGLPLAAKTFGGILRPSVDMQAWEYIFRSEIWDLPEGGEHIINSLLLSYRNLSYQPDQCSALMRCFAYCSIFPKGHEFQKEKLVLLWIAEGYIKDDDEALGGRYFNDLVFKFLLQKSTSVSPTFVMHDLIRDMARFVMGGIGFLEKPEDTQEIPSRTRHFTFYQSMTDNEERLRVLRGVNCLRTFLPFEVPRNSSHFCMSKPVLQSLIGRGSHLRVLSLSNYDITDLPGSKGKLRFLRYLDLSNTLIRALPLSVYTLGSLLTLLLTSCGRLEVLKKNIGEVLPKLRHLDISGINRLQDIPDERSGLKIVR